MLSSRCLRALLLTAFFDVAVSAQVISTVAGSPWVFTGGPATSAPLGSLPSVIIDSSGNIFAADYSNNIVVKITPSGTLTVVAGNGCATNCPALGDFGPATSASLTPVGVAEDAAGNLYIADWQNDRIRKVTPAGIISTFAGNGQIGNYNTPSGQWVEGNGLPASSGNLYYPSSVVMDGMGNTYIVDTYHCQIRIVTSLGTIGVAVNLRGLCGYGGDGVQALGAALNYPRGIAIDTAGNLYIADTLDNRVRKVTPAGIISTVAGSGTGGYSGDGGPATSATLDQPISVAVNSSGTLYIVDQLNKVVRKVGPDGTISTFAGGGAAFPGDGGPATSAMLSPEGVAVDSSGNVFIGEMAGRLRKVSPAGILSTVAGSGGYRFAGDGGPATSASLNGTWGVAVDGAGDLYISDQTNQRVRKVNSSGIINTVAGNGGTGFSGDGAAATSAEINTPYGIGADTTGNLFIADNGNQRIRRVAANGTISTVAGNGTKGFSGDGGPAASASLNSPRSVVADSSGSFYFADDLNGRVRKVTPDGVIQTVAGGGTNSPGDGGPATSASLGPYGVALDAAGNLYIADAGLASVRKVTPAGIISTVAGNSCRSSCALGDGGPALSGSLNVPQALAVDASGNIYIADSQNNRVRKVIPGGTINTVAGNGQFGTSGDGGLATNASLGTPLGVAVDSGGNLYIAQYQGTVVRKIAAAAPPAVNASGIVDGASFKQQAVAGGSIVSLFGTNLAFAQLGASSVPLSGTLGATAVTVNGTPAPLFFTSPGQLNFQVPWEAAGSATASVVVTVNGVINGSPTSTASLALIPAAPGIFTLNSSGSGQGAVQIANTTIFAAPAGSVPGAQAQPVARGQYITIYCSGLGAVQNPPVSGAAGSGQMMVTTPALTIGGVAVTPSFSGLAPGFVGLYQVNAQVPQSVQPGSTVPLLLTAGGVNSNQVTIAVQ
jgi:uncharacterized protein (TIGR03437 family)